MIIVFGGIKGGSGKTTLATNVAVMRSMQGKKCTLVDGDEQASALTWTETREALGHESHFICVQLSGSSIGKQILKLQDQCDDVIVDVSGRDTTTQRSSLSVADLLILPYQPRSLDVWTTGKTKAMISEIEVSNHKLNVAALLNRADHRGVNNDDSEDILRKNYSCVLLPICNRIAFNSASNDGQAVIEHKSKDEKAIFEVQQLYDWIFKRR